MRFKNRKWKSAVSWMLIVAMLGGYGNTALAAGIGSQGNGTIENIQEEAGAAGTDTETGGSTVPEEEIQPGGDSEDPKT